LLNLGEIRKSQLGSFYPASAVPLSALALLLVILLLSDQSTISQSVRAATLIIGILLSIVGLIGFIYFSTSKNDLVIEKDPSKTCYWYVSGTRGGNGYKSEIQHKAGRLIEVRKPCEYRDLEPRTPSNMLPKQEIVWTDDETKTDIGIDSIEYYALGFFNLCFIAFTASFTMVSLALEDIAY
jgi:hypothetical protein